METKHRCLNIVLPIVGKIFNTLSPNAADDKFLIANLVFSVFILPIYPNLSSIHSSSHRVYKNLLSNPKLL